MEVISRTGIVQAVSLTRNSFEMNGEWYNLDKGTTAEEKKKVIDELTDIFAGDTIGVSCNDKRFYKKIWKVSSKPKITKDTPQDKVVNIDSIIKNKGEVWGKCFNKIHKEFMEEQHGKKYNEKEIRLTEGGVMSILPSVNSLFIEVNKTIREKR